MADDNKQKCFVIMPFTVRAEDLDKYHGDRNHWKEVYHGLIVPAVEKAGLTCERDDEDSGSRLITENICRKLEEADVILCDLSASNPNVYLELGWALRADKKYVLIKDDVTEFNFDLNQCSTCVYSHMLQPSELKSTVAKLVGALETTANDQDKRYSMVSKLSITLGAIEAVKGGDVESGLLKQVLDEIRTISRNPLQQFPTQAPQSRSIQSVRSHDDLATWLPGTTWQRCDTDETISFWRNGAFILENHDNGWTRSGTYRMGDQSGELYLAWADAPLAERCVFSDDLTQFLLLASSPSRWMFVQQ